MRRSTGMKLPTSSGGPRTTTRVALSKEMFDVACLAIYRGSLANRRTISLRAAVVQGLDALIRSTRIDRFILLKRLARDKAADEVVLAIPFDDTERRLLREVRQLLQEQSLQKLLIPQVITVALLALIEDTAPPSKL